LDNVLTDRIFCTEISLLTERFVLEHLLQWKYLDDHVDEQGSDTAEVKKWLMHSTTIASGSGQVD
jgi:hypothetical protein